MERLRIGLGVLVLAMLLGPGAAVRGDVFITEFLAANDDGLDDEDGDTSDWIELFNSGPGAVNLQNWFLTDDRTGASRWRLPAVSIDAGTFLVVFASGKDRAVVGSELHTDFRLRAGGEYLGLLEPDGTPAHEYAPTYPEQFADVSYGVATGASQVVLVSSSSPALVKVPTDGTDELRWNGSDPAYDDSDWISGQLGVGYENNSGYEALIGLDVGPLMTAATTAYIRIDFDVTDLAAITDLTLRMKYDDGFVAYLNGEGVASRNPPALLQWDSAAAADHPDSQASVFEDFALGGLLHLLQAGPNVLAIHGLNRSTGSSDFLIVPELVATLAPTGIDGSATGYFTTPTPGAGNGVPGDPPAEAVAFSHETGVYRQGFTLTLSAPEPDAVIHFTTNGAVPTTGSPVYAGPISIPSSIRIRAASIRPGRSLGKVVSHGYIFLDASAANFSSDVPLIVLSTFGRSVASGSTSSLLTPATAIFIEPGLDGRTRIDDVPQFAGRSGIRTRGQTSQGWPKKQYAFEIWEEGNSDTTAIVARAAADRAVSLFGMPSESDWIIHGPYSDKTLMRNYLSYTWSRKIGRYAVRTRFCEVFLDASGGTVRYPGDYIGAYVFMEKIKRDKNRVDIARLTPEHNSMPEITGGYIYKKDKSGTGNETQWTTSRGQSLQHVEPKSREITSPQINWLRNHVNNMESAIYGGSFADPVNGYARYLDADAWIDHWIMVELTKNIDGFRLSTYYHKDRGGLIKQGPIWDYNLSLGNADYLNGESPTGWYNDGISSTQYPYWDRLFQDPNFTQKLADRWQQLRRGVFSTPQLLGDIDVATAVLSEAQVRNFQKWRILGVYLWPNGFVGQTWEADVSWMRNSWLQPRLAWIDSQFVAPVTFSQNGGAVEPGFELQMFAPSGMIHYTLDGTDPRLSGGGISPQATEYTARVALTASAGVVARTRVSNRWSGPTSATFLVGRPPAVRITEVMYNPIGGSDFEFLEVQNIGDTPVSLGGASFTNGITYAFPPAPPLAPGDYVVLVGNAAAFADRYPGVAIGGTFAGTKLANGGEKVTLKDAIGITMASVDYRDDGFWPIGPDGFGYSLVVIDPAANLDAPDNWRASTEVHGSPGRADPLPPIGGVVINEVLTASQLPFEDAIELYNPTASAIDVGGWFLSDGRTNADALRKYRLANGIVVPAGEYLVVYENQFNPTPGAGASFALSAAGESVYLSAANTGGGLTGYITALDFGVAEPGVSFGRWSTSTGTDLTAMQATSFGIDEPASVEAFRAGTGAPNRRPKVGAVVINEIMYHPSLRAIGEADGPVDDFIELHNLTDAPIALYDNTLGAGWRVDGVFTPGTTDDFTFGPGTQIVADGYLLLVGVVPSGFRTADEVPGDVPIIGPYGGGLDNGGEVLSLSKPILLADGTIGYVRVDRVRYDDADPWPRSPDGEDASLERRAPGAYGNDVVNWAASKDLGGSPGRQNTVFRLHGDADDDRDIDLADYVAFQGCFSGSGILADDACRWADDDGDGDVDLSDLLALMTAFTGPQVQHEPPRARAGPDRLLKTTSLTLVVTLDGTASVATNSPIVTYEWSLVGEVLGQGAIFDVELPRGVHTIRLTVTDANGLSDDDTVRIEVESTRRR